MEFTSLKIIEPILKALRKSGYVEPTPIQEKTIPLLLKDKDVMGIAQTGTGKTAAFVVPILQKLYETPGRTGNPRALILAPTRELAAQISASFRTYGAFLNFNHLEVYGGVGIVPQIKRLQKGVDILIATPGRLIDLMNRRKVSLDSVEFFVLDEADRMLDMGFVNDVKKIASALPRKRQSLFFSATMSNKVADLARDFLKNPIRVEITPQATPVDKIEQCVFFVDHENKNELLLDLIEQQKMSRVLVFVKAKHRADKVARILSQNRISADAIHGNKSQPYRTKVLREFKNGKIRVLVATDIAARGIEVENISHVINFDLPNEPENYVHRIGRTARAGKEGTAYSFCAAEDRNFLNQIERMIKAKTPEASHKYHSVKAKSAEGVDAKPKPRSPRPSRGGNRRFSRGRNSKSSERSEGGGSRGGGGNRSEGGRSRGGGSGRFGRSRESGRSEGGRSRGGGSDSGRRSDSSRPGRRVRGRK